MQSAPCYALRHRLSASLIACVVLLSCSGPEVKPTLTPEEQVRQDSKLGVKLAAGFESGLPKIADSEVAVFLRALCERLATGSPALKDAPIGVVVIEDRTGTWRNYALPGIRVYLSLGLLKAVEFENELAAVIALQLGHVEHRHVVRNIEERVGLEPDHPGALTSLFPSPYGERKDDQVGTLTKDAVFYYSEEQEFEAIERAVELLYQGGYDPRGLAALWSKYKASPERSPYPVATLDKFVERTYQSIVRFSPLRNPIVRSERFVAVMKRIERL